MVENLPARAGALRDLGSTPESGRSPGGGHGNALQYSRLENPTDRGACRATVHRVAKSQTLLSDYTHTQTQTHRHTHTQTHTHTVNPGMYPSSIQQKYLMRIPFGCF